MENQQSRQRERRPGERRPRRRAQVDKKVQESIAHAEEVLQDSMQPVMIRGLTPFQRKQVHRHFEKTQEFKVKTYKEDTGFVMRIYPVGKLRRLAEQKAQEVLMKGEPEVLSPMGSFERFVVHDYLKDRDGVKTESFGEGEERHVEIHPLYGRSLKKAKRKLIR